MTKEIIIIALIIVIVYLLYQQNNKPNIDNNQQIEQLQNEVKHYQTLYEQRLAKDVGDSVKVKELTEKVRICEEIINKPRLNAETQTDLTGEDLINLDKKAEYYQKLSQQKEKTLTLTQQELRNSQNNSEELEKLLETKEQEQQEQLRKINLLFDHQANNYPVIDFNGLYSLLKTIAERERERERERETKLGNSPEVEEPNKPLSHKDKRKMKKK